MTVDDGGALAQLRRGALEHCVLRRLTGLNDTATTSWGELAEVGLVASEGTGSIRCSAGCARTNSSRPRGGESERPPRRYYPHARRLPGVAGVRPAWREFRASVDRLVDGRQRRCRPPPTAAGRLSRAFCGSRPGSCPPRTLPRWSPTSRSTSRRPPRRGVNGRPTCATSWTAWHSEALVVEMPMPPPVTLVAPFRAAASSRRPSFCSSSRNSRAHLPRRGSRALAWIVGLVLVGLATRWTSREKRRAAAVLGSGYPITAIGMLLGGLVAFRTAADPAGNPERRPDLHRRCRRRPGSRSSPAGSHPAISPPIRHSAPPDARRSLSVAGAPPCEDGVMTTLTVPARFNGPPSSNGGWSAGRLAGRCETSAAEPVVTVRSARHPTGGRAACRVGWRRRASPGRRDPCRDGECRAVPGEPVSAR